MSGVEYSYHNTGKSYFTNKKIRFRIIYKIDHLNRNHDNNRLSTGLVWFLVQ